MWRPAIRYILCAKLQGRPEDLCTVCCGNVCTKLYDVTFLTAVNIVICVMDIFHRHILPNSGSGAGSVSVRSVTVWYGAYCAEPLTKTRKTGRLHKTVRQHLCVSCVFLSMHGKRGMLCRAVTAGESWSLGFYEKALLNTEDQGTAISLNVGIFNS